VVVRRPPGALSQEHAGRGAARLWLDMFNNDVGMQQRFAAEE